MFLWGIKNIRHRIEKFLHSKSFKSYYSWVWYIELYRLIAYISLKIFNMNKIISNPLSWNSSCLDIILTQFILISIPFDIIDTLLFCSVAKRICKGNGCHAQHSNLYQLEHRYKDELKTCMKRNGQWIHNVTSWRRCCHWQIVFFCFVEWILLVRRKELRIHIIHFSISYISDL